MRIERKLFLENSFINFDFYLRFFIKKILKPFDILKLLNIRTNKKSHYALSIFYHFCALLDSYPSSKRLEINKNLKSIKNLNDIIPKALKENYENTLNEFFSGNFKNDYFKERFSVAIHNNNVIQTSNANTLKNELYRWVDNPLYQINELDSLVEYSTRLVNQNLQSHFLAFVHLRRSNPTIFETHTNGFHRDTNSFKTFKLFIPLNNFKTPFLEFYPSTELKDLMFPAICPNHISKLKLLDKYPELNNTNSNYTDIGFLNCSLVNTTAIHREMPSQEIRYNLILTYLKHKDFGHNRFLINPATATKWSTSPVKDKLMKFAKILN